MLTAIPSAQNLEHTSRKEILFGSPQRLCFDVRGERVILQNCTEEGPAIHQQHWDFQEVSPIPEMQADHNKLPVS